MITGQLSFDAAYGAHTYEKEERAGIKTKGLAICETDKGEFCGAGQMKSMLSLTVTEANKESVSGTGEMELIFRADSEDSDTFIANNLSWTFDSGARSIYLSGFGFDDGKSLFKVEIIGYVPELDSDQSGMFMTTTITGTNGNTITGFTAGTGTDILGLVGGKDKVEQ